MKCYGCGVDKDPNVEEASPYADEDGLSDEPGQPLLVVECEGSNGYKATVVCYECFHKLQPDMWISEQCWIKINPRIPYEKLPEVAKENKWHVETYQEIE